MSEEKDDENQTELYHFTRGAFVDTDWFPGELDKNDEVIRVSKAGDFPESYYLERFRLQRGSTQPAQALIRINNSPTTIKLPTLQTASGWRPRCSTSNSPS